ncbi:hypothetical protein CHH64_01950 [Terribacillus saccharophilus]|uniref:Uncharacterized protein n=1 Tax=Terribacillus saccharophilus TaxID=361277 RepID=A0A268AEF1_9BACI|nr:hypothetical protein CHH64_01950 [Terribacillus saccharophilus]
MKSGKSRLGTEKEVRKPVEQVLLLAGIQCLQRSFWFLELDNNRKAEKAVQKRRNKRESPEWAL